MEHNPRCLACGTENPRSLGFRIVETGAGWLRATVGFDGLHEGAPGRVHGGAVATALDEALGQVGVLECGGDCATAEMTVRYHRPTATEHSFVLDARLTRRDGRKMWIDAELRDDDGEVLASASGLLIVMRPAA